MPVSKFKETVQPRHTPSESLVFDFSPYADKIKRSFVVRIAQHSSASEPEQ